eukprot:1224806-Prymnesium_polylepis.1
MARAPPFYGTCPSLNMARAPPFYDTCPSLNMTHAAYSSMNDATIIASCCSASVTRALSLPLTCHTREHMPCEDLQRALAT